MVRKHLISFKVLSFLGTFFLGWPFPGQMLVAGTVAQPPIHNHHHPASCNEVATQVSNHIFFSFSKSSHNASCSSCIINTSSLRLLLSVICMDS
jgi:hypothetical protein